MRNAHRMTTLISLVSLLALSQGASPADGDQSGYGSKNPRTLTVFEVKRLYGERPSIIQFSTGRGDIRYEVFPDGRVFGHNDSLIGTAAVAAGTSSGKWRVDEGSGAVCHEWDNARWTNSCSRVVETEPGAYAWSRRGGTGSLKFSINPQ